jgi:putative endonuclease
MVHGGTTYIMTNKNNTTLCCGITSDLVSRVMQHKGKVFPRSFTARYNLFKLVFYNSFPRIEEAIDFEKYIKGKRRSWKDELISEMYPDWKDLWKDIKDW